ncbi:MAG: Fe-S oxidoreductase, partial [Candidatus Kapabacteria bacterium]|nr:Fe-S oxidoreductase [Candidatus Kapabacteria bacterium]
METKNYIFILILSFAVGLFVRSLMRLISFLSHARFEVRWDNLFARISHTFTVGILQKKILRDKTAGPIHAAIFWGFVILLSAAAEAVLEGTHPMLNLNWLGPVYSMFTVLVDVFCAFIIVGVVLSLWRRYITKVKRLQVESEKVEAGMILLAIFTIVSGLLIQNSARIALHADYSHAVRPVATMVAGVFSNMFSTDALHGIFETAWWVHILVIFGFTNYLPYSKHLHVFTSIPNVFFSQVEYPNDLEKIDFEQEGIEKFGVNDIEDFS